MLLATAHRADLRSRGNHILHFLDLLDDVDVSRFLDQHIFKIVLHAHVKTPSLLLPPRGALAARLAHATDPRVLPPF